MTNGAPDISSRTLRRGSGLISFLEGGHGEAIVFLHSFGADSHLWLPQLRAFVRGYHVLAPDLPGHGDTTWESELVPARMADDVAALARHIGLNRVVLVGLSMGANIALVTAAMNPWLVRGLVLASAFTQPSGDLRTVLNGMADEAERVIDMNEYALRRANRMLIRAPSVSTGEFYAGARKMSKIGMVTLSRSLANWDLTPIVRTIRVPTVVLVGDEDPYVSRGMAGELAGHIEDSKLVVLKDAAHLCNLDAPRQFNHAVQSFLDDLDDVPGIGR